MDLPRTTHRPGHCELLEGFERHRAYLRAFLARFAGETEAEDLLQEVMLIACRKIHSFRGDSTVRTWLRRIAINRAINERSAHMRRRAREVQFALLREQQGPCPFEATVAAETLERLKTTLSEMPFEWREVLDARMVAGATLMAVARAQHVSIGTVHRREKLAKQHLSDTIEQG